jgi:glycine cleavage system H protein
MRRKNGKAITRRDFLADAGLLVGGSVIASLGISTSCNSSNVVTTTPGTTAPATSPVSPTTSIPLTTESTTPTTTQSAIPTPTSSTQAPPSPSSTISNPLVPFRPQTTAPAYLPTPGCQSVVARDRVYSKDHIWVKSLSDTICVMGITDKFQLLISNPKYISLPKIGATITNDGVFGDIEGMKLSSDLISPVSGMVLDVNSSLLTLASQIIALQPIIESPYISGWLVEVQMTKPDELKSLMTPEKYVEFTAELH